MSRFVDRDRDPIFWNGLRVLIQQLEQSSWVLGAATQCCSGGHGPQDPDALVTTVKHVISSVQSIQEGLDGLTTQISSAHFGTESRDERVKGEISFLCGEVHVLTDALLDVAQILASSPKPSPSLSTCFELLCLELTLQARALTGHLSSSNTDYEHAF
ncbi:hypothetical protein AB1E18_008722 [Capra hircus]